MDKAGKAYWDKVWKGERVKNCNPKETKLSNHINLQFHYLFKEIFGDIETKGKKLLELGCANSIWLPYFSQEYGFDVAGMDYSESGCRRAKEVLRTHNIGGEICCCDFFDPPKDMLGTFDVIISMGVIEHFQDTAACISKFSKFLKPGGIMITSVPNMVGLVGKIQKLINRPNYDIHLPIDKDLLISTHQKAGLDIVHSSYFLFSNFGVCNLEGLVQSPLNTAKKILLAAMVRLSMVTWKFEKWLRPNRITSPYVVCMARK